jgi:hypothetical protein
MKVLALILGLGMIQATIDGIGSFFPAPKAHNFFYMKEKRWDDTWKCAHCGHTNYNWTSICGKCGRSK